MVWDGTDKVGLARWAGFVGVCALFMFFCEVLSWWRGALACPVTSGRELASDGMGGAVLRVKLGEARGGQTDRQVAGEKG